MEVDMIHILNVCISALIERFYSIQYGSFLCQAL